MKYDIKIECDSEDMDRATEMACIAKSIAVFLVDNVEVTIGIDDHPERVIV